MACSQKGCVFPAKANGLCGEHQWAARNTPLIPGVKVQSSLAIPPRHVEESKPVGKAEFTPRITIEDSPTQPGVHDVWMWHLPNGKTEVHGVVGVVAKAICVANYIRKLSTLKVLVDSEDVLISDPPESVPVESDVAARDLILQALAEGQDTPLAMAAWIETKHKTKIKVTTIDRVLDDLLWEKKATLKTPDGQCDRWMLIESDEPEPPRNGVEPVPVVVESVKQVTPDIQTRITAPAPDSARPITQKQRVYEALQAGHTTSAAIAKQIDGISSSSVSAHLSFLEKENRAHRVGLKGPQVIWELGPASAAIAPSAELSVATDTPPMDVPQLESSPAALCTCGKPMFHYGRCKTVQTPKPAVKPFPSDDDYIDSPIKTNIHWNEVEGTVAIAFSDTIDRLKMTAVQARKFIAQFSGIVDKVDAAAVAVTVSETVTESKVTTVEETRITERAVVVDVPAPAAPVELVPVIAPTENGLAKAKQWEWLEPVVETNFAKVPKKSRYWSPLENTFDSDVLMEAVLNYGRELDWISNEAEDALDKMVEASRDQWIYHEAKRLTDEFLGRAWDKFNRNPVTGELTEDIDELSFDFDCHFAWDGMFDCLVPLLKRLKKSDEDLEIANGRIARLEEELKEKANGAKHG